jgi:probable rRNA maturation factor
LLIINDERQSPSIIDVDFGQLYSLCLKQFDLGETVEMSLTLMDPDDVQQLNLEYREQDKTTDVLSFPLYDPDELGSTTDFLLPLGDVIINVDAAASQALERGHTTQAELTLLFIHGFLHLMGYDHGTPDEKKEMFDLQAELLKRVNVNIQNLGDHVS